MYTVVTTDYNGEMLFTFENGKMAKVALSNYETKTNRKNLSVHTEISRRYVI